MEQFKHAFGINKMQYFYEQFIRKTGFPIFTVKYKYNAKEN